MPDTPAAVKRFLAGHRAASKRQAVLMEERGPLPEQAISECLSGLSVLEALGYWPGPRDIVNEREARLVQARWAKVKREFCSVEKS